MDKENIPNVRTNSRNYLYYYVYYYNYLCYNIISFAGLKEKQIEESKRTLETS